MAGAAYHPSWRASRACSSFSARSCGPARRRVGQEHASAADLLTLSRGVCAALLAGLITARLRDRTGLAAWVAWAATLWASTLGDWLDGPLARRWGQTRLGGAMDIEADSWVTLWSAAYAVFNNSLPNWCLLAPVVRYVHPLLDVKAGDLPRGGGPWWARVTGAAQMGLILVALAPTRWRWRRRVLTTTVGPISMSQLVVQTALLARRWSPPTLVDRVRDRRGRVRQPRFALRRGRGK